MSAAHEFRTERRVSGAHEIDERTKGLNIKNYIGAFLEIVSDYRLQGQDFQFP